MSKASLIVGNSNWAIKDSSLLGYNINDSNIYSPFPFDVTRASAATTVNKAGLIVTDEEILSGDLVINGDFATDSDWTKQSNWNISNGKANSNGSGLIYQTSVSYVDGKTYKVTFNANITSGIGTVRIGNTSSAKAFANGFNEFYLQTDASNTTRYLFFYGNSFIGSIDNVSVVEVNQNNLARIDYLDSTDGVLLTEPQSTNLYVQSSSFVGNWQASNLNLTLSSVLSPNGIDYATKIEQTANYGNYYKGKTVISGSDYTHSIFAKKGNTDWIYLRPIDFDVSADNKVWFDLNNGVVGTDSASVGSIKDYGNGWYRCSVKFNTTTDLTGRVLGYNCNSDGDSVGSVGLTSYIWGAQLEQKSYSTSIIPTSGSTVTRNQDLVNNGGEVSTFNSEEGVLFVEIAALANSGNTRMINISDGTTLNRVEISYSSSDNLIRVVFTIGGVSTAFNASIAANVFNFNKIAFRYKENDFKAYLNGINVFTQTSGATFPLNTLNRVDFGIPSVGFNFFGKTKNIQVFKKALTDAELIKLTTI